MPGLTLKRFPKAPRLRPRQRCVVRDAENPNGPQSRFCPYFKQDCFEKLDPKSVFASSTRFGLRADAVACCCGVRSRSN